MDDSKGYQHMSKEEYMFGIEDLNDVVEVDTEDDGDFDMGGTSSQDDVPKEPIIIPPLSETPAPSILQAPKVINPPAPRKTSPLYEAYKKERSAFPFRSKQKSLCVQLDAYDTSICSTINNQFCFMPAGQLLSLSYFYEQMKAIKKNPDIQPAMYKNIESLLTEYLGLIDSRFSLFKSTLLIPHATNHYYPENLYALDLNFFNFGYSREKYSVMTPFMLMELLDKKPLKKYQLAALFDDLEFCCLPDNSNADTAIVQL
ncbi:hypothetical protein ALP05_00669 [Pseudomonas caricapapayae]|uniref:Uncharacterized protein n=1 Tax=Pseudomonas caricapapayae TaxID=46678 RepID=A0A3M6F968_9PSED|nr:hypothetical protein [Pseudomonas caricapapayae]RMV76454.1 hypothetical protein ALP05_00669 [Pseudomonas caricapapayae]